MLTFWKATSKEFKNRETSRYFSHSKFSGVICNEFWLRVKLIWNKNIFSEEIYRKKKQEGVKNALPSPV